MGVMSGPRNQLRGKETSHYVVSELWFNSSGNHVTYIKIAIGYFWLNLQGLLNYEINQLSHFRTLITTIRSHTQLIYLQHKTRQSAWCSMDKVWLHPHAYRRSMKMTVYIQSVSYGRWEWLYVHSNFHWNLVCTLTPCPVSPSSVDPGIMFFLL